MSIASRIRDYIQTIPTNEEGYRPIDWDKMSSDMKIPRARLGSHVSAMAHKGKVELVRGEDDRRVVGIAALHMEDRRKGNSGRPKGKKKWEQQQQQQQVAVAPRRVVETPELDRVFAARSAMHDFIAQFPGLVDEARATAAIRIDPGKVEAYAHEGISLLERNAYLERRMSELRARNTELERELGYKRKVNNAQVREALATAGVVHAEQ